MTENLDKAANKIAAARTELILDYPWFGTLALRLHPEPSDQYPLMATDGTTLYYQPDWVLTTPKPEIMAVIAHEVLHCALLHPFRAGGRDFAKWNIACDLAINPLLKDSGFKLPAGVLLEPQYAGMSAEMIYTKLPDSDEAGNGQPQPDFLKPPSTQPSPGAPGTQPGDQPAGSAPTPELLSEQDWQIAAEQATLVSNKAGTTPGFAIRELARVRESHTDWRTILRRFVENVMPSDYSWTSPNRRYVAAGLYLPGTIRENCPRLALGVDTSGSIGHRALEQVAGELQEIMSEVHPAGLDVVYCDSRITRVESFEDDDGPLQLHPLGGGGTRFQPVFDYFNELPEPPAALIYFSQDLENADHPAEPDYPVLWISGLTERTAPFGEHVTIAEF